MNKRNSLLDLLNNATTKAAGEVGDGVALYSCGGPHFAPMNPAVGDTFYCAIGEATYVYGDAGWKLSDKVIAHPAVVEKENRRIIDGLRKLTRARR